MMKPAEKPLWVAPTFGVARFDGAQAVFASQTAGILFTRELVQMTSLEMDVSLSRFNVNNDHNIHQLGTSAALRLNLLETIVTPYMSAGFGGNYFTGLRRTANVHYSDWVIAGVLSVGTDVAVAPQLSLGVRGSYYAPALHASSKAGDEDGPLLNKGFYRAMAVVSMAL